MLCYRLISRSFGYAVLLIKDSPFRIMWHRTILLEVWSKLLRKLFQTNFYINCSVFLIKSRDLIVMFTSDYWREQNVPLLSVQSGGMYSNHWILKGYNIIWHELYRTLTFRSIFTCAFILTEKSCPLLVVVRNELVPMFVMRVYGGLETEFQALTSALCRG
jgi:hypothetical protein